MPQLRCYMNLLALNGDGRQFLPLMEAVNAAGYEGVQFASLGTDEERSICRKLNLGIAASGRINAPEDAPELAARVAGDGYDCATLHVGWGIENDDEAACLIESILQASQRRNVRFYIETHRATICQDMWRAVQFLNRFPDMRFNGDFSHWYAGQEMVYGGFDKKLRFIEPVLNRVRFLHGRVANPGCIQVPVQEDAPYLGHFKELWTASFRGFLQSGEADSICFAPELLGPDIYYARIFEGREETDRWNEALKLKEIAARCFASALHS